MSSAGGLLAGVMANFRPGLFSAMVMKVRLLVRVLCLAGCHRCTKGVVADTARHRRREGEMVERERERERERQRQRQRRRRRDFDQHYRFLSCCTGGCVTRDTARRWRRWRTTAGWPSLPPTQPAPPCAPTPIHPRAHRGDDHAGPFSGGAFRDARLLTAAHGARVRRVGRPQQQRGGGGGDPVALSPRERARARVPGAAGDCFRQRQQVREGMRLSVRSFTFEGCNTFKCCAGAGGQAGRSRFICSSTLDGSGIGLLLHPFRKRGGWERAWRQCLGHLTSTSFFFWHPRVPGLQ